MPWSPTYSKEQLEAAVAGVVTWAEVTEALGLAYHGKTIATARRAAGRWEIDVGHLSDRRGVAPMKRRYTEEELRSAVARSYSWAASLRELGYCPSGGNWKTLKRRCAQLGIPTDHFDPHAAVRASARGRRIPLEKILVEDSTFSRQRLKERLFEAGIKQRECEHCGQGEEWRGRRIGLIIDHINGVRDDHRLDNLQIVCPNCAASLDTHCGRKNRLPSVTSHCGFCGKRFTIRHPGHRFCSIQCGARGRQSLRGVPRKAARKVPRPSREELLALTQALGFAAVGRRYGVSDNAVRKWLRSYEREAERTQHSTPLSPQDPA